MNEVSDVFAMINPGAGGKTYEDPPSGSHKEGTQIPEKTWHNSHLHVYN